MWWLGTAQVDYAGGDKCGDKCQDLESKDILDYKNALDDLIKAVSVAHSMGKTLRDFWATLIWSEEILMVKGNCFPPHPMKYHCLKLKGFIVPSIHYSFIYLIQFCNHNGILGRTTNHWLKFMYSHGWGWWKLQRRWWQANKTCCGHSASWQLFHTWVSPIARAYMCALDLQNAHMWNLHMFI